MLTFTEKKDAICDSTTFYLPNKIIKNILKYCYKHRIINNNRDLKRIIKRFKDEFRLDNNSKKYKIINKSMIQKKYLEKFMTSDLLNKFTNIRYLKLINNSTKKTKKEIYSILGYAESIKSYIYISFSVFEKIINKKLNVNPEKKVTIKKIFFADEIETILKSSMEIDIDYSKFQLKLKNQSLHSLVFEDNSNVEKYEINFFDIFNKNI